MPALTRTELIDFSALSDGGDKPSHLLDNLGSLLVLTARECPDHQLRIYDTVLQELAGLVEQEARAALAEKLADLRRGPAGIVRKLAADSIEVARPLLARSPLLDDYDLKEICETCADDHMFEISGRQTVPACVTEVIVERGGAKVLARLTDNIGAKFSHDSFSRLIGRAANDERLQESLCDRPDFPSDMIRNLIAIATERVRDKLSKQGREFEASLVEDAAPLATAKLTADVAAAHYDFESAERRTRQLAQSGELTEAHLANMARQNAFEDVVWSYALLIGLPFNEALSKLTASSPGHFLISARAQIFSDDTVSAVLRCGPWRDLLSPDTLEKSQRQFQRMNVVTARRVVQGWQPARSA